MKIVKSIPDLVLVVVPGLCLSFVCGVRTAKALDLHSTQTASVELQSLAQTIAGGAETTNPPALPSALAEFSNKLYDRADPDPFNEPSNGSNQILLSESHSNSLEADPNAPNLEPDPGQDQPQDQRPQDQRPQNQRPQNQNEQDSRTLNLNQPEDEVGNTENDSTPNLDPLEDEDEPAEENEEIEPEDEDEESTDDNSSEAVDTESDASDSSDIPIIELESVPSIDDDAPIPIDQAPLQTDDEDNGSLTTADPELGVLILQEREPSISRPQQEIPVFLSGKLSFFDTDNAFSGLDPVNDQLWQFGVSVSATPTLGPRTLLIAEAEGTLVRYSSLSDLDYNELSLQTSLWHVFASGFYGEVGWQNRQLFANDDGDRFLDEHSLQTRLFYRTQFTDDLRLDTYYQLRVSFTTPKDRSRILNRLVTSLTYDLAPDVEVGLIYLLSYTNYTQTERQDLSNQISAQISYEFSPRTKISLFSGYSFGDSTDSDISFDNFIFGATVNVGVRLF